MTAIIIICGPDVCVTQL